MYILPHDAIVRERWFFDSKTKKLSVSPKHSFSLNKARLFAQHLMEQTTLNREILSVIKNRFQSTASLF